MCNELKKLWIRYREKEAILKYYEGKKIGTKERIFAEADFFRAGQAIWSYVFKHL